MAKAQLPLLDPAALQSSLDNRGHARLPELLTKAECASLREIYGREKRFRSFIDMGRHGYGEGDYRYFADPLPALVKKLRTRLYEALVPIVNVWEERLGSETRFPPTLREFTETCRAGDQARPTPLLLHYEEGGYNCLHQDLYGPIHFPLQVACLLSDPEREFTGGDLLLVEQRPRAQSRGEAISLAQGEGLVFPCRERPVEGKRGFHRVRVRHGVSTLLRGERFTLGVIFHDAA